MNKKLQYLSVTDLYLAVKPTSTILCFKRQVNSHLHFERLPYKFLDSCPINLGLFTLFTIPTDCSPKSSVVHSFAVQDLRNGL